MSAEDRSRQPAEAPDDQPAADPGPEAEAAAGSGVSANGEPAADPDAPASGSAGLPLASGSLAEEVTGLDALKRERDEYLELAQRTRADFENYRKRAAREASDAERRGRMAVARELVPAVDSMERALGSAGSAPEALAQGIELVLRELQGGLDRSGVEAYDPTGQAFDPTWHEAVATRPAEDAEPGTVLETLDKGYRLDGQVLRAAKVVVGE